MPFGECTGYYWGGGAWSGFLGGVMGGVWERLFLGGGGGVREGRLRVGGCPGGATGGGGGTCPQGQALVNHRLLLPPLALPLTIPSP